MLWASFSAWVILEACGHSLDGGFEQPPSYTYLYVRPEDVSGFAEEKKPGIKRCTWIAVHGKYRLVKGSAEEVACRLARDWPECTEHVRPK